MQQETAKRIAAEAVMDPASELHKRLQMAAPVVAAGLVYQPQIAIDRMRRNAALHNDSVSADSISIASRSQLNALQRGTLVHSTLAAPQTADYLLLQAPLSSPLFVFFCGESDLEDKDYHTCSEAISNVDVCDVCFPNCATLQILIFILTRQQTSFVIGLRPLQRPAAGGFAHRSVAISKIFEIFFHSLVTLVHFQFF